jgi:hypothetical protein
MKKVIIIIEDNFTDFKDIKSVVDSKYECKQQYTEETDYNTDVPGSFINSLKASLQSSCASDAEYANQTILKKQLQEKLIGYCNEDEEPVYLIDYLLDGGGRGNIINGIRFIEIFLEKMYPDKIIPVMFITSSSRTPRVKVDNYVTKINDKSICDFQTKPNKKDWHLPIVENKILNFIENAKSIPRQKTKGKNIEDIYEND